MNSTLTNTDIKAGIVTGVVILPLIAVIIVCCCFISYSRYRQHLNYQRYQQEYEQV